MSETSPTLYDVGGFIRQKRQAGGLTQSELAVAAGLPDANAISGLERGSDYNRMLGRLEQVAVALGMSLPDLVRKSLGRKAVRP